MKPATAKALQLVSEGKTPYMAAKLCGISASTVARAIERQKNACPTCGKPIKEVK